MSSRDMWFIAGLIILALLSQAGTRIAGGVVVLIVVFLAIELANQNLI